MAKGQGGATHSRRARAANRTHKAPGCTPHDDERSNADANAALHILPAIYAEVSAMRQDLRDVINTQGRWIPLKEAYRRIGVSIDTLRAELKRADAAGETTIFEGIRFRRVGRGEKKPRYTIWAPSIASAREVGRA